MENQYRRLLSIERRPIYFGPKLLDLKMHEISRYLDIWGYLFSLCFLWYSKSTKSKNEQETERLHVLQEFDVFALVDKSENY